MRWWPQRRQCTLYASRASPHISPPITSLGGPISGRDVSSKLEIGDLHSIEAGQVVSAPALADPVPEFARAVVVGLSERPLWLPCRFLYDEAGSEIFERITSAAEYYPTRKEAEILAAASDDIRDRTGPVTLVELGSGNSAKTNLLLRAYAQDGSRVRYVPIDVSESALVEAADSITRWHREVEVRGIHATYEAAFPLLGQVSPAMVLFLGSTIGNLNQTEAAQFWTAFAGHLGAGDFVLLGLDLVKDPDIINPAYNDAAGHSAAFTKNVFERMNRELGSDIDIDAIEHVAAYREQWQRVEIFARFSRDQAIFVEPYNQSISVAAGDQVMTEVSRKFILGQQERYLACFGLEVREIYLDSDEWFAVLLLQRRR